MICAMYGSFLKRSCFLPKIENLENLPLLAGKDSKMRVSVCEGAFQEKILQVSHLSQGVSEEWH